MATELRTGIGGVTLQGEDSDDGARSVLQRACLCLPALMGAELGWFRGFSRSALRTCAAGWAIEWQGRAGAMEREREWLFTLESGFL